MIEANEDNFLTNHPLWARCLRASTSATLESQKGCGDSTGTGILPDCLERLRFGVPPSSLVLLGLGWAASAGFIALADLGPDLVLACVGLSMGRMTGANGGGASDTVGRVASTTFLCRPAWKQPQ